MKNYLESIVNLTGDTYLNPNQAYGDGSGTHQRDLSQITQIAIHHDASIRPHDYDSIARYKSEATLHYQTLGPGLQYHYKIDNTGTIFAIRPLTTWLYAVGSADNVNTISICLDGYFHAPHDQVPTQEQFEALKQLLDTLSTDHPEFPASQANVFPHRHFSATACCGDNLVGFVDGYRTTNGDIAIPQVGYDWPEFQPHITPTPEPPTNPDTSHTQPEAQIPVVDIDNLPEYERTYVKNRRDAVTKQDSHAVDMTSAGSVLFVPVNTMINIAGDFTSEGKSYVRTVYSEDHDKWYGLPEEAFDDTVIVPINTDPLPEGHVNNDPVPAEPEAVPETPNKPTPNLIDIIIRFLAALLGPLLRRVGKK